MYLSVTYVKCAKLKSWFLCHLLLYTHKITVDNVISDYVALSVSHVPAWQFKLSLIFILTIGFQGGNIVHNIIYNQLVKSKLLTF